ncbi:MAG: acetylxylan esterase [Spirochaetes bacterium]|nr:acetylxylan esterase [Spirochaetota bacterium]
METGINVAKYLTCFFMLGTLAFAGSFRFMGSTDKNPIAYEAGETMIFTVQLLEDGKPVAGKNLTWKRFGDDGRSNEGKAVSSADEPLVITTSIDRPGFVRIIVTAFDENGKRLMNGGKPIPNFDGGAGVALDKIEGWPEPADFDAFWAKQKARLAAVPMRADIVPVESDRPDVLLFDIKVDCAGKMPVSGYLSRPKGAAPGSLPIRMGFQGYGVKGAAKPAEFTTNALIFNINAHGILNGQPIEYYAQLEKTTLKNYAFIAEENKAPETAYFNGMFLRVVRALEFIKSQPEWDGKNITVSSGSQGAFQCLAAAALDRDVTFCKILMPWSCDLSGAVKHDRQPGWLPRWTNALGYYDGANLARHIKCSISIVSGLGDYICPPSTQAVLYNNITAPKKIIFQQGSTHEYQMPGGARYTLSSKDWVE